MKSSLLGAFLTLLIVGGPVATAQPPSAPAAAQGSGKKLALLVGCTKYPKVRSATIRELQGPNNDLPMFGRLLKEKFGFSDEAITVLKGADETQADAPTRKNIAAAFAELAEQATPGSQVVILISGHGSQVPAVQDQNEADGLDEVFLPMDVQPWSGSKIPNAIRDDEFGAWLDQIRGKGAYVWAIFDCCHSGTMFRGASGDEAEVSRQVRAEDLNVPPEAMKQARSKAEKTTSVDIPKPATAGATAPAGGLTVFYAAQSFEETPELPRPRGAPRKSNHIYGLFTYMLVQTLQQQQATLEYRELSQAIVDAYRRERGSRGPTPLFDGDLDRQVLGAMNWPTAETFQLLRQDDAVVLNAGELHGLTKDSVLAVHPPAGDPRDRATVLGYVRVQQVNPFDAAVEACEHNGMRATELSKLPDGARCQLVLRDVGDMHVRISVVSTPGANSFAVPLRAVLTTIAGEPEKLLAVQPQGETIDWWLHCVNKLEARSLYGRDVSSDAALLVQQVVETEKSLDRLGAIRPQVFASYPLPEPGNAEQEADLRDAIRSDVQKIFTWQNLLRVGGLSKAGGKDQDVRLTVKLQDGDDASANPTVLKDQQRIQVLVENQGIEDWHVVLLYLDRNLGIRTWVSEAIQAQSSWRPRAATIDGSARGTEGLVLLAYPLTQRRTSVATYLVQDPVGLYATRGVESEESEESVGPFARLLKGAAANRATRGLAVGSPDQPLIQMHTWLTERKEQ